MQRNILLILISVMTIFSLMAQTAAISEELESNIQSRMDANDIHGIVIGMTQDGHATYTAKGVRSLLEKETVDENTVFEIGSISKTFTGLMLADLVVRGKVNLDDSIQQYLPEGIKAPVRNGQVIKLFHLSNHTSGLPRMPSNFNPSDNQNPFADYSEENMYEFLDGYELPRDIGSLYEYSNLATGILGSIVSSVNNKTYEELLVAAIAEPLGMEHTSITQVRGPLAKGHVGGNEIPNWDFGSLQGAGAIRSTAADMMRYLQANMGITETKLYPAMQLAHKNSGAGDSNPIVGLGWHTMIYEDQEILWHNGATGGYTSFMGWIKGTDKGVVVLNNSTEKVDDIGLHALIPSYPLEETRTSIELDEETLASYVGQYALTPAFILTVTLQKNQLSVQATGQSALPIYPESETRFFYKLVDAQLEFQQDEAGKVESVTLFQGGQEIIGKRIE